MARRQIWNLKVALLDREGNVLLERDVPGIAGSHLGGRPTIEIIRTDAENPEINWMKMQISIEKVERA